MRLEAIAKSKGGDESLESYEKFELERCAVQYRESLKETRQRAKISYQRWVRQQSDSRHRSQRLFHAPYSRMTYSTAFVWYLAQITRYARQLMQARRQSQALNTSKIRSGPAVWELPKILERRGSQALSATIDITIQARNAAYEAIPDSLLEASSTLRARAYKAIPDSLVQASSTLSSRATGALPNLGDNIPCLYCLEA